MWMLALTSAALVAILVGAGYWLLYNVAFGPNDYSCNVADPTPLTDIRSRYLLQECAAGKSFAISRGETIAIDLQNHYGVDTYEEWRDLSAADSSVLGTVEAPTRIGLRPRSDEVAVYAGLRSGVSEVTATRYSCGSFGTCGGRQRWRVKVRVS